MADHDDPHVLSECRAGQAEAGGEGHSPDQMRFHDVVLPVLTYF